MRVIKEAKIGDKTLGALFNSGSSRTYVSREVIADKFKAYEIPAFKVGLGGEELAIHEICALIFEVEDCVLSTSAYLIDKGFTINGKQVELIVGATTCEEWEIKIDPRTGDIDLSAARRRNFTEL